jgi:hypothetical protein
VSDVNVSFALKVGSELVREEDLPSGDKIDGLTSREGLFGALVIEVDGEEIVRESHWDRLDAVLEHVLEAIDEAESGAEGVAEFPNTRLELTIREGIDDDMHELEFDETVVQVKLDAFRTAVIDCVDRLVELVDEVTERPPPALRRLRALVRED